MQRGNKKGAEEISIQDRLEIVFLVLRHFLRNLFLSQTAGCALSPDIWGLCRTRVLYNFIKQKVPFNISANPMDSVGGQWLAASPKTAGDFSATAYFYARKLFKELHVPIGIIQSSIGGTPAEVLKIEHFSS